jgi:hypothetical protein
MHSIKGREQSQEKRLRGGRRMGGGGEGGQTAPKSDQNSCWSRDKIYGYGSLPFLPLSPYLFPPSSFLTISDPYL